MFNGLIHKMANRKLRKGVERVPRSWRTSIWGVCAIIGATAQLVVALFDDDSKTNPNWEVIGAQYALGFGLLTAASSNVVKELQDKTEK